MHIVVTTNKGANVACPYQMLADVTRIISINSAKSIFVILLKQKILTPYFLSYKTIYTQNS
jgi:hypothetical protein